MVPWPLSSTFGVFEFPGPTKSLKPTVVNLDGLMPVSRIATLIFACCSLCGFKIPIISAVFSDHSMLDDRFVLKFISAVGGGCRETTYWYAMLLPPLFCVPETIELCGEDAPSCCCDEAEPYPGKGASIGFESTR